MKDILIKQANPYKTSVNWNFEDDTQEQVAKMYDKVDNSVTIDVRLALASAKTTRLVLDITDKFNIKEPERVGETARIVRDIFVDKISGQEVVNRVVGKLKISPAQKDDFLAEIRQIILQIKEIAKEEKTIVFDEMAIIPAINKYREKLSSQEITFERLKIPEIDPEQEFEPTIKNWIDDYIQKKGAETHPILVRNDYLFNSENGKNLNEEERERLSEILESYDNDKLLLIYKLEGDPTVYFQQKTRRQEKNVAAEKEASVPQFEVKKELQKPQPMSINLKKPQLPEKFFEKSNLPKEYQKNNLPATQGVRDLVIENSQAVDYEKENSSKQGNSLKTEDSLDTKSLKEKRNSSQKKSKLLILEKKPNKEVSVNTVNLKKV
ncbi:MAG TPA: hypothetical protein GX706_04265 [Candidatus Moranbacteria bacterium]|nr:hypothetical protein [Candidatus Moranbacteria bacterium]